MTRKIAPKRDSKRPPGPYPKGDPKEEELDKLLRAMERNQRAQDRKNRARTKSTPAGRK